MYYYYTIDYNWQKKTKKQNVRCIYVVALGILLHELRHSNCPSNEFFPTQFRFVKFFHFTFLWVHQFGPAKTRRYFKCYDVVPSQCHQLWVYILAASYTHLWPVGPKNIRKKDFVFFKEKKVKGAAAHQNASRIGKTLRISTSGPSLKMASESCCLLIFFFRVSLSKSEWEK